MRESELLSNGFLNKTGLPDLSLLKCDSMFGCFNFPTVWSTIFFQEKNYVFHFAYDMFNESYVQNVKRMIYWFLINMFSTSLIDILSNELQVIEKKQNEYDLFNNNWTRKGNSSNKTWNFRQGAEINMADPTWFQLIKFFFSCVCVNL